MLVFTVYFMGERSLEASDVTKHGRHLGRHLGNHGKRRRELVKTCFFTQNDFRPSATVHLISLLHSRFYCRRLQLGLSIV